MNNQQHSESASVATLSLQDILSVTDAVVSEQGRHTTNPRRRHILQQALSVTSATLMMPTEVIAEDWLQPTDELLNRFVRAIAPSVYLDEQVFTELESRTQAYWQYRLMAASSSSHLLASVRQYFSLLTSLLQDSMLPSERKRLCAIGSDTAQLLAMLSFDLRKFARARQFAHVAIRAAQEAEHPCLEAIAWGNLSFAWTYDAQPQKALPCIQPALRAFQTGVFEAW